MRLANRIAHLDMLPDLEDRWYGLETLRGDGVTGQSLNVWGEDHWIGKRCEGHVKVKVT